MTVHLTVMRSRRKTWKLMQNVVLKMLAVSHSKGMSFCFDFRIRILRNYSECSENEQVEK